jgi:ribosomal-protein-alanine N-acetyltransferase
MIGTMEKEKNEEISRIGAFPIIETPRLILRDIQLKDAQRFFEIRSDQEVMRYMDREPFQFIEEAEEMIKASIEAYLQHTAVNWSITLKGSHEMVGYVSFLKWQREHFRAEVGYALLPVYQGKGIMSEALGAVIKYGFESMKLHRIEADVNPGNMASIKLLEKFGFHGEAYFRENIFFNGKFVDSVIYGLLAITDEDEVPKTGVKV